MERRECHRKLEKIFGRQMFVFKTVLSEDGHATEF